MVAVVGTLCSPHRGAAGRLMKLEDIQVLLDDFGLPLQIGNSSSTNETRVSHALAR